jgi:hypothetical protein
MLAGDIDLKAWYKPEIDKKILKELSKRSDLRGAVDITLFISTSSTLRIFFNSNMGILVIYSSYSSLWKYFLLQNYQYPA